MTKEQYRPPKPPLPIDRQVKLLCDRGLVIDAPAEKQLARIGYYRLSGYWFPFQDKENDDHFIRGTSLAQIIELYEFDRALRALLFEYAGIIEIQARTLIANHMGIECGTFAHIEPDNFYDKRHHAAFMDKYRAEVARQMGKSPFVTHNMSTYGELPIWAAVEVISLGTLSKLYGNIKSAKVRKGIAKTCYLSWKRYKNWLEVLSYIRNACAHHQRLYGRSLPYTVDLRGDNNGTSLYAVFLIMQDLMTDYVKRDALLQSLNSLFEKSQYIDARRIGFPDDWYTSLRAVG
jgi:abortive infection bacteriophage resistance protein